MLKKIALIIGLCLFLSGCAVHHVKLHEQFWHTTNQKIAVAESTPIKPDLYQYGNQGLLDLVISDITSRRLIDYLTVYDLQKIDSLKTELAQRLRTKNMKVIVEKERIELDDLENFRGDRKVYAAQNFTTLPLATHADKLLLISEKAIGAVRQYYSFIPLGAPRAVCKLEGQLIDLKSNAVLWHYTSNVSIDIVGEWDQPPAYPNFSQALDKAIATAKEELLLDFFSNT